MEAAVSTGLVAFLGARYAEREAVARDVDLRAAGSSWYSASDLERSHNEGGAGLTDFDARFIVQNNPTYVLADLKAKRQILTAHAEHVRDPDFCRTCGKTWGPCETKRALAAPFVDHPEYREDWGLA